MAARKKRKKTETLNFEEAYGGNFERMLTAMPDQFLDCRDMRHAWFKKGVKYIGNEKLYERTMGCRRCGAEKIQLVNASTGELITGLPGFQHGYHYPPNYIVKGVGRLTRADNALIRLTSVVRAVK